MRTHSSVRDRQLATFLASLALGALGTACRSEGSERALGLERAPASRAAEASPPTQTATPRAGAKTASARMLSVLETEADREAALAALAAERTASPDVDRIARAIVADHATTTRELEALRAAARIEKAPLDDEPYVEARRAVADERLADLRELSGADFDRAVLAELDAHQLLVARMAERARTASDDPELAAFFDKLATRARANHGHVLAQLPDQCGHIKPKLRAPTTARAPAGSTVSDAPSGQTVNAGDADPSRSAPIAPTSPRPGPAGAPWAVESPLPADTPPELVEP